MIVRNLEDVSLAGLCVAWGNGTSHRLLTKSDQMGFTLCHTVVFPGTEARLQYSRHLEACYCIAGTGEIVTSAGEVHVISSGTMYALDKHDAHTLRNPGEVNFVLLSVFNPPLSGEEAHNLTGDGYSGY